jgi:tRNA:m(5)U-54 methyltransferase
MKPVGLDDPRTGRWPRAVVQLRQDNKQATLWNIVGFQTKLKHAEQVRIFRMIPGLEKAEFARLGGLHRNTFIRSPILLDGTLRLKSRPGIRFAGQITGCEGYVESAAIGLLAGRFAAAELAGRTLPAPPLTTALGALLGHITGEAESADERQFRPVPAVRKPAEEGRSQGGLYVARAGRHGAVARGDRDGASVASVAPAKAGPREGEMQRPPPKMPAFAGMTGTGLTFLQ